MKLCPTCNRTYTDDSLNFCLQDGTVLSKTSSPQQPFDAGVALGDETTLDHHVDPPPTEILYARASPTDTSHAPTPTAAPPPPPRPTAPPYIASPAAQDFVPPRKSHRTALIITATLLALSLLLVIAGIGAWLLLRDGNDNEARATRASDDQRQPSVNTSAPVNGSSRPSANTYVAPNANAPAPTLIPTQTPTPISSVAIRDQVIATLNGWAAATRARDLNRHMSYYADTLDAYYKSTNVSASRVRADRERAYAIYSALDVQLTNMQVVPDPTGERATATFDKTWSFTGQKTSTGSVQQRIWLAKAGGRWRITAEKELQIYYVNNQ